MSGRVPVDRTIKQPAEGFCRNPECAEDGKEFHFTVEHDLFSCPKCGANTSPMIGVLVLTHLLVRDESGPIIGAGGLRWALACSEDRAYLATATNQEAATDNLHLINCPGCVAGALKRGLPISRGWAYQP